VKAASLNAFVPPDKRKLEDVIEALRGGHRCEAVRRYNPTNMKLRVTQ